MNATDKELILAQAKHKHRLKGYKVRMTEIVPYVNVNGEQKQVREPIVRFFCSAAIKGGMVFADEMDAEDIVMDLNREQREEGYLTKYLHEVVPYYE